MTVDENGAECKKVLGVKITTSISIADLLLALTVALGGAMFVFDNKEKTAVNASSIESLKVTVMRLEENSRERDDAILTQLQGIDRKLTRVIEREIERR